MKWALLQVATVSATPFVSPTWKQSVIFSLSLLLCFVCFIVLRENYTPSHRWRKYGKLLFCISRNYMGPTSRFHTSGPCRCLSLDLWQSGLTLRVCVQILTPSLTSNVALGKLFKHSLCLTFHLCKLEVTIVCTSQSFYEIVLVENLVKGWEHRKH